MNASDQIISVLNDLCAKFGLVVDWGSQNVMPYLTELVERYKDYIVARDIISVCVPAVIIILSIVFIVIGVNCGDEDIGMGLFVISCIPLLISLAFLIFNIYGLAKSIYVPELRMLEDIKKLLNT